MFVIGLLVRFWLYEYFWGGVAVKLADLGLICFWGDKGGFLNGGWGYFKGDTFSSIKIS